MDKIFNTTTGLWALRQLLQFGGAWLVFMGYADESTANGLIDALFQVAGPVSVLVGFAANIFATFRNKVTVDGKAIPTTELPATKATEVKQIARAAAKKRPNLLDRLFGSKAQ